MQRSLLGAPTCQHPARKGGYLRGLQSKVSFGNLAISARCRRRASTSASVSTRSSGSISSPLPKSYWTSTRPSSSGSKPRRSWNSFLTNPYMAQVGVRQIDEGEGKRVAPGKLAGLLVGLLGRF